MAKFNHPSLPQEQIRRPKDSGSSLRSQASTSSSNLKQIQYRSYQHTIAIYHFRTSFMSVHQFRNLLSRNEHGYIDTLIGKDTLLGHQFIPDGDEVPPNRIEVAYLPYVFRSANARFADGSALGFRSQEGAIEWMCFDRCIKGLVLDAWTCMRTANNTIDIRISNALDRNDPSRLFDHVADLEKGITKRAVRGAHEEHRLFHLSLWEAECRNVKVTLVWRGFGEELKKDYERKMRVKGVQAEGDREKD